MRRLFKVGSDRHDVGSVIFAWHPDGNLLASAGKNGFVQITDRHGDIMDEIPMNTQEKILDLVWDHDGENLAILQDGNGVVPLWNATTRKTIPLDTSLRDLSFVAWSKTGPQLAVGSRKGNLVVYNKSTKKKVSIVGKHAGRISCGCWSESGENKLVLGSDDSTITVSNEAGDTLLHTELRSAPTELAFALRRSPTQHDSTVSSTLDKGTLLLLNTLEDKEAPLELTFALNNTGGGCKYGEIRHHEWLDPSSVAVGFSFGYLLVVSTKGSEKHMSRIHPSSLITFAYNSQIKRIATAGDDGIRIVDLSDFKEVAADFIPLEDLENGKPSGIAWSPDGQILTVATVAGNVYNFLAKISIVSARYKTSVAYLSSLREVSVIDMNKKSSRPVDVTLRLEPSLIALGAKCVAAAMNNRVYYHKISSSGNAAQAGDPTPFLEQEYTGTVRDVQLNRRFAAVLSDSKATLHLLEQNAEGNDKMQTFPSRQDGSYSRVTCLALTDEFLYYGTEAGTVEMFYLADWVALAAAELRMTSAAKQLYPNESGSRVVVVDIQNQVYLFNPVAGGRNGLSLTRFDMAPGSVTSVLWDSKDENVIMLFDGRSVHTYVYVKISMKGPILTKLGPVSVTADGEIVLQPEKIDIIGPGCVPLISSSGLIHFQSPSGELGAALHPFFSNLEGSRTANGFRERESEQLLNSRFCQNVALLKLEASWQAALMLDSRPIWLALSHKAMELLNTDLAIRVYRQLGDAGMVTALQAIGTVEDANLLSGHIALLFGDYSRAQEMFLTSSQPEAALQMRKDLLQWDQAMKLAQAINPAEIPEICIRYGQQMESRGETDAALKMFEMVISEIELTGGGAAGDGEGEIDAEALIMHGESKSRGDGRGRFEGRDFDFKSSSEDSRSKRAVGKPPAKSTNDPKSALVNLALMGLSRCYLRLGNLSRGQSIADEVRDKSLYAECGEILEQQKHFTEAAAMHLKGEQFERAAYIYTKYLIKSDKSKIDEAALLMEKVKNDQLHSEFAKVCVKMGRFEEAIRSFERAKDITKVVELKLTKVDQVQQAFDLVRQFPSSESAQVVADFCRKSQDYGAEIEFLLIANKFDEAFKQAQAYSMVDKYAVLLGDNISPDDAMKVANYYEKVQDYGRAGKFYSLCANYSRALKLFIQCGDREIDSAIEVVGKSQNEGLTHQLIDFLVGEKDGVPKDPNYIYRLYIALKKYEDAAKTAMIIARQEQDMGNYQLAHSVVFETIRHLEVADIKIPSQLRQSFVLLHSYALVKYLVKSGDHMGAARMLVRIAASVSKFPVHVVPILTSTVIECQRAGMKASSYEYAMTLMRPEHRALIDANLKRKIEAIVRRKSSQTEEAPEDMSPCPVCGTAIPHSQLECPTTRDALPMCIITGRHMVLSDWCFCPNSKSPALYSQYVRFIQAESGSAVTTGGGAGSSGSGGLGAAPATAVDPVLGQPVSVSDLQKASAEEAQAFIRRYNNIFDEKKKQEEDDDADEEEEEGAPGQRERERQARGTGTSSSKAESHQQETRDSYGGAPVQQSPGSRGRLGANKDDRFKGMLKDTKEPISPAAPDGGVRQFANGKGGAGEGTDSPDRWRARN